MLFFHWLNNSTKCVCETKVSQTILLFFQKRCSLHSCAFSSSSVQFPLLKCPHGPILNDPRPCCTLVCCVHGTTLHLHNTEHGLQTLTCHHPVLSPQALLIIYLITLQCFSVLSEYSPLICGPVNILHQTSESANLLLILKDVIMHQPHYK